MSWWSDPHRRQPTRPAFRAWQSSPRTGRVQLPRQRERKEQDADLEGTKRAQTGFGKTWRKGVQKAGSGGDVRAQELTSDLLNLQSVGANVVTMHKVEAGFVFILPFF